MRINNSPKHAQYAYVVLALAIVLSVTMVSKGYKLPNALRVDFEKGMAPASQFNGFSSVLLKSGRWKLVKDYYDKFLRTFTYSRQPRICKVIHQIWLGSPLPERYKRLQASWLKRHPAWEYKLWTDKDIEELKLYNKELYDAASNYAEKSDIARYEILYRYGGLYVDTDFECLSSFDILHHSLDFYAGIIFKKNLRINNALIGAVAGHPILKYCIKEMKRKPKNQTDILATVTYTGPLYFTNVVMKYLKNYPSERCVLFPNTFFYPITRSQRKMNSYEKVRPWIKPETFAVHYWDASWVKK